MDFGGQYCQLIARRVREQNVFCEIKSYKTTAEEIVKAGYKGVIFTGGPNSVYDENAPKCDPELLPAACRCSEFAMALSLWLILSAARWQAQR